MSILNIESTDRRCAEADAFKMSENLFGARMTHSISTSSGVDGATSNLGHRGGKKLTVRIQMLDDSVTIFQVQAKALGKVLFEQVCRQLNLLEADYFGLEYQEISSHTKYWLDLEKPLNRQVGFSLMDPLLRFCVKFYTPDPAQLEEEYTRYMFCLQIKRDLSSGNLPCNDNTAAIMSSYIVQASCGDFVPEDYPDHKYLSSYRFVPHQDDLMQRKIMENHKKHIGQSPAEADMNLLETARRCELYGMKMHSAKDIEGVPLNLAVAHMGITVFQNITRINTFSWAKIRKLSFKRKRFLIKLHPEGYGYYKDTVEFYFEGRNECKNFWKKCVENHGFFRCITIQKQPRRKSRVLSRGSSFRYSGKTQKQMIEFVRENYVKRQTFQRSQSFRQGTFSSSSRCQSKSYVNSSISANPLLPVNTADWDCQNRNSDFTTNAMRMETVTLDHQQNIFTDSTLVQVTAAQAEILPPTNLLSETQNKEAAKTKHSALFQNQQLKNSVNNNSSSNDNNTNLAAIALEQDHFRQNVHSIDLDDDDTKNTLSLRRRSRGVDIQSLYDLTLGSDKSSNQSCSETGTYDVIQAEDLQTKIKQAKIEDQTKSIGVKKRKWKNETSYYVIKELLMTERTYKRDLEILNDALRQCLTTKYIENLHPLFDMLDAMNQHHNKFLREMEHIILEFETSGVTESRIGDIMLRHLSVLPIYADYAQSNIDILQCLNDVCAVDVQFENVFSHFEQKNICYLPVAELMLKPLYRILHYELLFQCLCEFYPRSNIDFVDCQAVYNILIRTSQQIREILFDSVNYVQMFELQRNITGINKLIQQPRGFVRHGYLLKHSKRGLQQCMFILLSDFLLYGIKLPTEDKFNILGHVPVRSLLTENAEHNMFLIYGGKSAITVSAATTAEKTLWLAELSKAAENIRDQIPTQLPLTLFKNRDSSKESIDTFTVGIESTISSKPHLSQQKIEKSRSNTALHVCWHRGATISIGDCIRSAENQLSGYLLRKFKNSSGWQKLWVVFASFCLYFYKSFQEETALASLPILGYTVGPPAHHDAVQKDFVFKLTFKNHIYFFRAESQQTYTRWLEVLKSTTQTQDFKNMYLK